MTDREKNTLIDILNKSFAEQYEKRGLLTAPHTADDLLANGVIVPPCKVGDTVYVLDDWGYKRELKTKEIGVIVIKGTNDFSKVFWEDIYGGEIGTFADIGKTIFLTKEQAEAKLRKRSDDNAL